ncbi:fungal-specific transcription factor domain-containing protein [Crucibulum laeve]|uniref:Fungal-specific transcription factor domain-containing protein n=1 Tax=Crucibulum laeve TaxID=68775 RepID=A0A5C3M9X2_9AGAR|nr:fungal-specific transcription factor domain-containing protein [Crucibulum laeve]
MGPAGKEKEEKTKRRPGRVPTSCAECRRLKLRCDRNVPCGKCISRGCTTICPDGELVPVKGHKLVLSGTEELHNQIDNLCNRIRQLEDALRTMQESVSDEPHPLLRDDALQLNADLGTSSSILNNNFSSRNRSPPIPFLNLKESVFNATHELRSEDESSVIDAFGTLSIGQYGVSSFLGKTARSEYLIHAPAKEESEDKLCYSRLSQRMKDSALACEPTDPSLREEVYSLLPPLSEAVRLCEIYLDHGKFLYIAISRTELFDEVLTKVYRVEAFDTCCHHSLALLFTIFALATLFDSTKPSCSIDAHEYYYLAKASLNFSPPFTDTTLACIQAMVHITQYLDLSGRDSIGSSSAWMYIGNAVRLGHKIGLHLNSTRWKLPDAEVSKRSRLFWHLITTDIWASFYLGRPPSISLSYIDCAMPQDVDNSTTPSQDTESNFAVWNWKFAILLHSIMATAFGPKQPPYPMILELDRKIRDFPIPEEWRPICPDLHPDADLGLSSHTVMRRWLILWAKESTLLNLHRAYFAQALHDAPPDLSRHRYIPSIISVYRSSWRILQSLRLAWKGTPQVISRLSLPWSNALSAAIALCVMITKAPGSNLSVPALVDIDDLLKLFEKAAPTSYSASNFLPFLKRLHGKAHEAFGRDQPYSEQQLTPEELDRLGGGTRLISKACHDGTEPPPLFQTYTAQHIDVSASKYNLLLDSHPSLSEQTVHPTIIEDMRNFGLGGRSDFIATQPFYDLPTASDVAVSQQYFRPSQEMYTGYCPQQAHPESAFPHSAPMSTGVEFEDNQLVLDATWQSLVEELGFN